MFTSVSSGKSLLNVRSFLGESSAAVDDSFGLRSRLVLSDLRDSIECMVAAMIWYLVEEDGLDGVDGSSGGGDGKGSGGDSEHSRIELLFLLYFMGFLIVVSVAYR